MLETNKNAKKDNTNNFYRLLESYKCRVILNIFCRLLCFAHVSCLVLFNYIYMHDQNFIFVPLGILIFAMTIEGYIVIIRHGGKQSKYFSTCMFLYLMSVIPYFWLLEMQSSKIQNTDAQVLLNYPKFLQQSFYIVIIFLRILLPKYNSPRDQTSNVVKFLLNVVSDAQELQSNVAELKKNKDQIIFNQFGVVELYLITWTWSLPLVCLNIDETLEYNDEEKTDINNLSKEQLVIEKRLAQLDSTYVFQLFKNFYWKFFFVLLLLDLPYLISRLVGKFYYEDSLPDAFFFTVKNACQVLLGIHRVICRVWLTEANLNTDSYSEESNEE